jgi:hypothetical protein
MKRIIRGERFITGSRVYEIQTIGNSNIPVYIGYKKDKK